MESGPPPYIHDQRWSICTDEVRPIERLEVLSAPSFAVGGAEQPADDYWTGLDREAVLRGEWHWAGQVISLRRLVITSEAGAGKSEALRWLYAHFNRTGSRRLALHVSALDFEKKSLKNRSGAKLTEALLRFLARQLARFSNTKGTPRQHRINEAACLRVIERCRATGQLVFLMDGLDQASPDPLWLNEVLTSPYWHKCGFVLAGRPYAIHPHKELLQSPRHRGDADPPPWRFVRLEPFDKHQITRYLGLGTGGRPTYEQLSTSVQQILPLPRVLKYLRQIHDGDWTTLQTAADVFERSLSNILDYGLENSREVRLLGHRGSKRTVPDKPVARHKQKLWELLGCLAYQMTFHSYDNPAAGAGPAKPQLNFGRIEPGIEFAKFAERIEAVYESPSRGKLDWDFQALAALGVPLRQGLFERGSAAQGLNQVEFADRSLQEFLTARYLAQYGTTHHAQVLGQFLPRPDRPATAAVRQIWQFLCHMPTSVVQSSANAWLTMVEPLYQRAQRQPGVTDENGEPVYRVERSTEMIFRSWPRLVELGEEPPANQQSQMDERAQTIRQRARAIRETWCGEFAAIARDEQTPTRQKTALAFQDSFLTIPAGLVTLGNPTGRRLVAEGHVARYRGWFAEGLRRNADSAWIDEWVAERLQHSFFGMGPAQNEQIEAWKALWQQSFATERRTGQGFQVIEMTLFGVANETWQENVPVAAFQLARSPVSNAMFRLFIPDHGVPPTPWAGRYKDFSPSGDHPAIYISFYDAWAYCQWARFDGQSCRLPWEHEWEYVAKLGGESHWRYWWHESEFDHQRATAFQKNARPETTKPNSTHASPATQKLERDPSREFRGIMDQLGNVLEWCQNEYEKIAPRQPSPVDGHADRSRVLRGGSFYISPDYCRSAFRDGRHPAYIVSGSGFRAARACSPLDLGPL